MTTKMLGKLPARRDGRTLRFGDYLTKFTLPPIAPNIDWSTACSDPFGMMGNDRIGDCTCAAIGHGIQIRTANANQEITLPDSDIIKAYSDITGYDPADPSTDQGANMLDVLNYARKVGFGGNRIDGYCSLSGTRKQLELSVMIFGGGYVGVRLPESCMHTNTWDFVTGQAIAGGHAIWAVDYNATGPVFISWGKLYPATWSWYEHYADEGYGLLDLDWMNIKGTAPNGFKLETLKADLALL
jgi:hypothetical protein